MSCGPNWLDWLIPDSPFGFDVKACCDGHDLSYGHPRDRPRKEIDMLFMVCMYEQARKGSTFWTRRGRYLLSRVYYRAVRLLGWVSWLRCRNPVRDIL